MNDVAFLKAQLPFVPRTWKSCLGKILPFLMCMYSYILCNVNSGGKRDTESVGRGRERGKEDGRGERETLCLFCLSLCPQCKMPTQGKYLKSENIDFLIHLLFQWLKYEHGIESGWILPTLLNSVNFFFIDTKVFFIFKMLFIEVDLTEFYSL